MGRNEVIGRENNLVKHIKLYCQRPLRITRRTAAICTAGLSAAAADLHNTADTSAAANLRRFNCVYATGLSTFLSVLWINF